MLLKVIDDTLAWLTARGVDATVDDGADALNEQLNFSGSFARVVFVPSAGPMPLAPPTFIGEDADGRRQLANLMATYDVVVTAYDAENANRRVAQQDKAVTLLESVVQAVQHAYWGAATWGSVSWVQTRKNQTHGAALSASLTLNIPLFDVPWGVASPSPLPGAPKPAED